MPPLKSANYIRRWADSSQKSPSGVFPFAACLAALEAVGIRTDYDLLLQPDTLVQTPAALHRHIKALRMAVLDHFSSPGQTAADLLARSEPTAEQPAFIKSEIAELDGLLLGGLPMRQVTELCAREPRIATQVAIDCAAAHLVPEHTPNSAISKVYYLQSGSLSLWRAEQAVTKRLKQFPAEQHDMLLRQALERLIVVDCGDADALLTFLHKYADARAAVGEAQATRDLVVIDSIRPLIVAVLQRQNDIDIEVHAVKTALRRITSARSPANTAVLVTNGVALRENSRAQPSLGTAWGMVSHTHLYLDAERSDGVDARPSVSTGACKVSAVVLKSPSISVNRQAVFEVDI
ncbi:DNA repair protein rad51d [Coemansia furcata]|uniref:DNA repair protein rad51d n=1 Tax=Coemansia furcata TaxID=417177 RepID=A0ACC1LKU8_9FUNG|nr:DNA repair protein rad51d [Coemansia furcata]